jgi:Cu+-exporting ATPase
MGDGTSLSGVATAIALSRATMRNIRQNLFFALVYNGVGIPVAAGVLYPLFGLRLSPMLAAVAMAASSLSVVGNANRLRRWHPAPLPAPEPSTVQPQVQTWTGGGAHQHAGTAEATVDAVCGMSVHPDSAAARRDLAGTTLLFCSTGCAEAFDAHPDRYPRPSTHHTG